ncbi:NACHT domain-containing protein [Lentzea sp. NPDC005914]|uniref:NACHT domain-containing protein n=1 Tax=Lentzea sp. NPDC005914 TaxID=3154572 RepID=UPI00340DE929
MAHEDRSLNTTGDVHGFVVQAHNVYLNRAVPETPPRPCEPPENWAAAAVLPVEIQRLLWAQEQAAKSPPYQLRGARRPSLGAVYVRQDLSSGVEDGPADHLRTGPVLDEFGRLVEVPGVASIRVSVRPPSKPLRAALDAEEHLIVIGGPGQGKSTLTLRLAAEIASHWSARTSEPPIEEPVVPLRVTARLLAAHLGPSFSRALADSVSAEYGLYLTEPVDAAWLASRVSGCRWLLIVDALDEVADVEQRAKLLDALAAWASSPTYRIVLTTRPSERGALAALQRAGAARYELQPFDEESIDRFAQGWFEDEDLAHRFLQQIREAHLSELVEVPLLATIAAIVFEKYGQRPLPGNQFELYESYLDYIRSSREVPDSFECYRVALVEHLGRTRLAADTSLIDVVEEWARLRDTPADELMANLKATGPFVERGNDLVFLHHSFAEHVAATAQARELPAPFNPEHGAFAKLLHATTALEEGRFARAVLLHYTYLHPAEADRMLAWLHGGGSEQHLLAARLLARHLPVSAPMVDEFLVTARQWAMTTQFRSGPILQQTSRATHHHGLVEWLRDLMDDEAAPRRSRAEAATALAVRVRGAHAATALAFLRSTVDDASARVEHRLTAAEALAQAGVGERAAAERGLRSVLADPLASGADCHTAAVVLSAFGTQARAVAVARLNDFLSDEDGDTADLVEAATGLVEIGAEFHERCAAVFRAVLTDPVSDFAGKRNAAIGMASLGAREEAAEVLAGFARARKHSSSARANAASALAALGPDHRAAAGSLLRAELEVQIPDSSDRAFFAPVLARIGHRGLAVELLRQVLADRTMMWSEVVLAASYLAELGPSFRDEAADHFENALAHVPPARLEHTYALQYLARLGEPYRRGAVARMDELLSDRSIEPENRLGLANEMVRCAPDLIAQIKDRVLAIATTDLDPKVIVKAWSVLRQFGAELQERACERLLALAHRDSEAPAQVGLAFGSAAASGRAAAGEVLLGIARDDERDVATRLSAAEGLRYLGPIYVRAGAECVCALIAADWIIDFPVAVNPFTGCGRGVRRLLADEVVRALGRYVFDAELSWSAAEALDLLGFPVPEPVLLRIADDEVADWGPRARAAAALARTDPARCENAVEVVFRAAASMATVEWRRVVGELAKMGVDVRRRLQTLAMDLNNSRTATRTAAYVLGAEGLDVLRAQAADPYMPFGFSGHLRWLLVKVDPGAHPEAITYLRTALGDPRLPIATRSEAAKRLYWLDRTCFVESTEALFGFAEDPQRTSGDRATAAVALATFFGTACPPRLTRLLTGLVHDPETHDGRRQDLVALVPPAQRAGLDLILLMDHSASIARRIPGRSARWNKALREKAEQVAREVLHAPEIRIRERREAAVELAAVSPRHVEEARAFLLSDGSDDALSRVALLGAWPQVHESARKIVLDETRDPRERRAAALVIGKLSKTPSVRDFLLCDREASWRDRVDELWYADALDELRAIRDDTRAPAAQRARAADRLDACTVDDRAAAARTLASIAADRSARPALRWRSARDLAAYGLRGRAEAVHLLDQIARDESLPITTRAEAAYQLGWYEPPRRGEMLDVLRGLLPAAKPLQQLNVLESIDMWSPQEAIGELFRMTADKRLGSLVRLRCAMEIVATRRDLRDRCAVVAREIAFDTEVPRHVRRRAARYLAEWSDVCREEARALLVKL